MPPARSEFEEFALAATPRLLRTAYLLTGDQHLAEDLVQTALAKAHRHWQRISHLENPFGYTRKILYHQHVAWWRRRKVTELLSDRPAERASPDDTAAVDLRLSMERALYRLSPRQRAVMTLRYFEDRSVAETAEILGCSHSTVKTTTLRALAKLRAALPSLPEITNGVE